MSLSCGCELRGGMEVSLEMLKEHYKHTFEALMFWELLMKPSLSPEERYKIDGPNMKLSQARIDILEAIDKLYPDASK